MKDGYLCFECGKTAEHHHHVVPKARGGTKTVPLCSSCHSLAHHLNKNMCRNTLIRERRQQLKAQNRPVGGDTPYGYTKSGPTIREHLGEQTIITVILGLIALGNSFTDAARVLNHHKVRARKGEWFPAQTRRIANRF